MAETPLQALHRLIDETKAIELVPLPQGFSIDPLSAEAERCDCSRLMPKFKGSN